MKPESVTVIMPVFNADKYLRAAVDSILNQTFSDFEFIMINDGSSDSSLSIMTDYAKNDSRIRLIDRENRGLVITLNEGISASRSDLVARMDADDIAHPKRLAKQVKYMNQHRQCILLGTQARVIDKDGLPIFTWNVPLQHEEIDTFNLEKCRGHILHPTAMFRKSYVEEVGGYSDAYRHAEDLDLWLKLAENGNIANLDDCLLDYRIHDQSVSAEYRDLQVLAATKAIEAAYKRRGYTQILRPEDNLRNKESSDTGDQNISRAWTALVNGFLPTARVYARRALLTNPFRVEIFKLLYCIYVRGN